MASPVVWTSEDGYSTSSHSSTSNSSSLKPVKPDGAPSSRAQYLGNARNKLRNAQHWLARRLAGTGPFDFHSGGVAIYTALRIDIPVNFQAVTHIRPSSQAKGVLQEGEAELLRDIPALLIFCDIHDKDQVQRAIGMEESLCMTLGDQRPPTILVPHSAVPEQQVRDDDLELTVLREAMIAGIAGTIVGEPEGFKMVLAVRNEMQSLSKRIDLIHITCCKNAKKVQVAKNLARALDYTIWHYLADRRRAPLPEVDVNLVPCVPGVLLSGLVVGKFMGGGSSGQVYRLEDPEHADMFTGQVVKTIAKAKITNILGLTTVSNEIRIMETLSSPEWTHKNIIKLYQVYHSGSAVLLRMQDGGNQNLWKALRGLDRKQFPLGKARSETIISQLLSAVCHLHLGPRIAHLDIKPENVVARETRRKGVTIQLCDFDLARYVPENRLTTTICGTFPFMAPDMFRQDGFDPFAADIWSAAIVFLEVLCCCDVIKKAVVGDEKPKSNKEKGVLTGKVHDFFEKKDAVANLLDAYLRPELRDRMENNLVALVKGMLNVHVPQRLTSGKIQSTLSKKVPESNFFASKEAMPNDRAPTKDNATSVATTATSSKSSAPA